MICLQSNLLWLDGFLQYLGFVNIWQMYYINNCVCSYMSNLVGKVQQQHQ